MAHLLRWNKWRTTDFGSDFLWKVLHNMLQHKSAWILQDVWIPNCTQKTYEKHPNITKYPWKMKIFAVNLESFTPDGKCLHRHHLGCLWQIWILLQNVNLQWCPLAKRLTTWKMETKDQDQFRQHSRLYMDGVGFNCTVCRFKFYFSKHHPHFLILPNQTDWLSEI